MSNVYMTPDAIAKGFVVEFSNAFPDMELAHGDCRLIGFKKPYETSDLMLTMDQFVDKFIKPAAHKIFFKLHEETKGRTIKFVALESPAGIPGKSSVQVYRGITARVMMMYDVERDQSMLCVDVGYQYA